MTNEQQAGTWAGHGEIVTDGTSLIWQPAHEVAQHAYGGFQLRLTERRSPGMRLIVPADGFFSRGTNSRIGPSVFHYDAPCGGLAVLIASGLDREGRQMYDTAFWHLRRLRSSQTWLKRQFTGPRDFRISQPMRVATGTRTAVPAFYDGRELQVGDLLRIGREEASQQGVADPTRDEVISFGLFAAAKQDPMPLDEEATVKVPSIVRSAMLEAEFAPGDVTDEELQMVTDRFADLVEPHLRSETGDFDRWLCGPKNSLARQIGNQHRAAGGVMDQKRVTAALAELGWRSLLISAKCIETQMRCVAADLPEPLSAEDQRRFELLYYRQDCFASVSLCLLAERFHFIRAGLFHLMEAPADPERISVLQRMLQYYAAGVAQRRDLDRQRKHLRADAGRRRTVRSGQRRNGRGIVFGNQGDD